MTSTTIKVIPRVLGILTAFYMLGSLFGLLTLPNPPAAKAATTAVAASATVIGETGSGQLNTTPQTVNLTYTYNDPVVVAFVNTWNDPEPVDVRVFNITSNSFQWFLEEPDGESHANETVSYIVMEKGRHLTNDGLAIEAGSVDTAAVHNSGGPYTGPTINFQSAFTATPTVLHTLNTYNNGQFMSSMAYNVTNTSFDVVQESGGTGHHTTAVTETIGWIAFRMGNGSTGGFAYEIGADMSTLFILPFLEINFSSFSNPPVVVVKGNSNLDASDGFWARGMHLTAALQRTLVQEDQVGDSEITHDAELLAWAAFAPGTFFVTGPCLVEANGDNAPDFAGIDAQVLRDAVAAANPGDTLRLAGTCAGTSGGHVVELTQDIKLIGGHNPSHWSETPNPDSYPTVLDAEETGRVIETDLITATLANLTIINGVTNNVGGGGLHLLGNITVTHSIIRNNQSRGGGGGIFAWAGLSSYENERFTLLDSVVEDNSVTDSNPAVGIGGGLYIEQLSQNLIRNTIFHHNVAQRGGAIYQSGYATTIENSTIYSNTAVTGIGGGIYSFLSRDGLNITNSTIAHNNGSGITNHDDFGIVTLMNISYTTIVSNSLQGIALTTNIPANHTATIANSLIAYNSTDCTTSGGVTLDTTSGYNLDSDGTCVTNGVNNNITASNPGVVPIGDYGGDTPTNALGPGSVAINRIPHGTNGCGNPISTDQRSISRPQASSCDIGAFESQGFTLQLISGSGQATQVNTAVAAPLVVAVVSNVAYEPVRATGIITFTGPSSGPSLNPMQQTAPLDANGQASLNTTVNGLSGTYIVTASMYGTASTVHFDLSNIATFNVACNVAALITALEVASVAGSIVKITLADDCLYNITAVHTANPDSYGAVGLPPLRGTSIITGNNATIQRDASAPLFRLFYIADTAAVAIDSFTLRNGYAAGSSGILGSNSGGGGIFNRGNLTIDRATWHQNRTTDGHGGALFNLEGSVIITQSTFAANSVSSAGYGGAIFNQNGTLELQYNTVASNTAANNGGAVYNYGGSASLTLVGSLLADSGHNNQDCVNNGGTVSTASSLIESHSGCGNGSPLVTDPLLADFGDHGGGSNTFALQLASPALDAITPGVNGCNTTITIDQRGETRPFDRGCDIGAYEEEEGFCFISLDASLTTNYNGNWGEALQTAVSVVSPSTLLKIAGNCIDVTTEGGTNQTVYINKSLTLAGGYDPNNWGAGADPTNTPTTLDALGNGRVVHINTNAAVTLSGLTLTGGHLTGAPYHGAGLFNNGATAILSNLYLTGNNADRCGGAIYNDNGTLTLTSSTLISNTADLEETYIQSCGGGLSNYQGLVHINSSTIVNNTAGGQGGAFHTEGGTIHISNSSMSNNQAGIGSAGYAISNGAVLITATTIVSNTAVFENSLDRSQGGTISLKQTIIGQNSGGSCPTQLNDLGYNLSDDNSCITHATSLFTAVTVAPLQDNGGDTWTHALPPNSPAIDVVPSASATVSLDQRGMSRPQGINHDSGAYEYVGTGTAVTPTLTISGSVTTTLSWSDYAANCAFDIALSTDPYGPYSPFINGQPNNSYTYAGTMGNVSLNTFYQVTAYACGNLNTAVSNTVGEFDFAITPGQ